MYRTLTTIHHGTRSAAVGALMLLAAPGAVLGQEEPPPPAVSLEVRTVVPGEVNLGAGTEAFRVELHGLFPRPTHRLLPRLSVTLTTGRHTCRAGWSPDLIRSLLDGSGQPWLTQSDLLSEDENDERIGCGTIDGIWEDHLELTVRHPGLLTPGSLRLGVLLSPERADDESVAVSTPSAESWGETVLTHPFRVLAHTPLFPLARAGDALRLSFAVSGTPPTSVEVAVDTGWAPIPFAMEGERVTVVVPPQLYRSPAHLTVRFSAPSNSTTSVTIPVCAGDAQTGVRCPRS